MENVFSICRDRALQKTDNCMFHFCLDEFLGSKKISHEDFETMLEQNNLIGEISNGDHVSKFSLV